jgi:glucose uptake protein
MITITNYFIAMVLCALAMICWGSWQNTRNVAGLSWRFELFYWDFITGILILSFISAITLGSLGSEGRTFFADIRQAELYRIGAAMLGGAVWNLGTLLLTAAIAIAGMSVAFPIGAGIAWILGIGINYIGAPKGDPLSLIIGSIAIIIAILLSMFSYRRLASFQKKTSIKGILISIIAGVTIAFFYRFVVISLDPSVTTQSTGKLTPYTAVFFFAIGAFISTFLYNPIFMRHPVEGVPVNLKDYLKGSTRKHLLGILGGMIWCTGMVVSFMATNTASPAISYGLSNSAPVVAAIWGIFVWKEFREAPKSTNKLLALMFLFYFIGLLFIVYAGN